MGGQRNKGNRKALNPTHKTSWQSRLRIFYVDLMWGNSEVASKTEVTRKKKGLGEGWVHWQGRVTEGLIDG